MTRLTSQSPVVRETSVSIHGRALIVTLLPGFVSIRRKGLKTSYVIGYDALYALGGRLEAGLPTIHPTPKKKV